MKGNLAVCASGFRNRAWVWVCKMTIKARAALRLTGVGIGYCFCRLMNEDATKTRRRRPHGYLARLVREKQSVEMWVWLILQIRQIVGVKFNGRGRFWWSTQYVVSLCPCLERWMSPTRLNSQGTIKIIVEHRMICDV